MIVSLPKGFVATKFPGYFWHIEEQQLYTIKVHGVLTPLKITKPNQRFNYLNEPAYRVCVRGVRRWLHLRDLRKLTYNNSEVPVAEKR